MKCGVENWRYVKFVFTIFLVLAQPKGILNYLANNNLKINLMEKRKSMELNKHFALF